MNSPQPGAAPPQRAAAEQQAEARRLDLAKEEADKTQAATRKHIYFLMLEIIQANERIMPC